MLVNLNDILLDAKKNKYAVGLFNTTDTDMLEAAITAAEELNSPIIIGTAEVLLPFGDLNLIAPSMVHMAKNAKVPVCIHFDHGVSYEKCIQALDLGFTSIMFDGSQLPYEENIQKTKELAIIAHKYGATIEGEIGSIGSTDTQEADTDLYTNPEQAKDFVERTGVDALAIAIGTVHGPYKKKPNLDINRLKVISDLIDTPLVLHGGSGLSDNDFKSTIENGISKINIFTDLCVSGELSLKANIGDGTTGMNGYLNARNLKVMAIKETVKEKLTLFGSSNKA